MNNASGQISQGWFTEMWAGFYKFAQASIRLGKFYRDPYKEV